MAFAVLDLTRGDGKPRHLFHSFSDDRTRPWPAQDLPAFGEYSLREAKYLSPNPIAPALEELQPVDLEQVEGTWPH